MGLIFIILGAPVGDHSFSNIFVLKQVRKARVLFKLLEGLDDVHCALHLLISCCSFGKFNHIIRSTPLQLVKQALEEFDLGVRECLGNLIGSSITDKSWLQATLSKQNSGLGLRSLVRHGHAAFTASFRRALPDVTGPFLEEAVGSLEEALGI